MIVALGIVALVGGAPTASAHTDFESSAPAEGDVIAEPVTSVVLVFTAVTEPVDDLVVALDADGNLQAPTSVTSDDQRTFTATFDPALAGGDIGIRWTVLGADGHPLQGTFAFTVTAPTPTSAPTTSAPPTSASATTDASTTPSPDAAGSTPSPAETVLEEAAASSTSSVPTATELASDDAAAQSLDEFLASDAEIAGQGRQLVGRLLSIPFAAAVIGALAFLAVTLRGPAREIAALVTGARVAAVVILLGAVVEYSGIVAATGGSFVSEWTETSSRATLIRMLGALAVAAGLRSTIVASQRMRPRPSSLSAAVIDDQVPRTRVRGHAPSERWDPGASKVASVGVALLVVSFWFDGHTVTEGWRPLHALVNSVHVIAGGVWFGGVISLAALAWWRHRRGADTRLGELVVRFSSLATVALAAVAVAGIVLAVVVLDGFGDLTGTQWGKTLLLKTAAVGLAAAMGAYNHFRLRPALAARPGDAQLSETLRAVLTGEAIVLSFVVVVTCWLVAAAT